MSFTYNFFCIAGHWSKDPGAIGVGGRRENLITIKLSSLIAERVTQLAELEGLNFIKVWKDDFNDPLVTVISKIRKIIQDHDFILDCHLNASSNSEATGTECVVNNFASKRSIDLGAKIAGICSKIWSIPNRGVKKEKDTPRKSLGITKLAGACVVWEASFITNVKDQNQLDLWMHWACEEIAHIVLSDAKKQYSTYRNQKRGIRNGKI